MFTRETLSDSILSLERFPSSSFHPSSLSGGFVKPSPRTRIARIDLETRLPFLSSVRSVDRLNFQPPTRKVLLDDEVPSVEVRLKEQGEAEGEGRGESTPPFSSPYSTGSQALNEIHTNPTITA